MPRLLALPLLLVPLLSPAAQDARPEDVVARAVDAAGGAGPLNRHPAGRLAAKGTLAVNGADEPVAVEQTYHVPGRVRTRVRAEAKGQKLDVLHVVNGAKVKYAINGVAIPATEAAAKEIRYAALLLEVGQLTPLLADRRFTLKPDRPAKGELNGVLVQVKGAPDIRLGFDRKTGHLVRVARRVHDPDTLKEGEVEQSFSDFKPFGGLTKPTRVVMTRDGQKLLDLTTETFVPLEAADPREFQTDN